ncbi:MAG: DUF4412 domain-containing protein [Acidobacteria bacterium]|nr:DUF4412 domain-containing protein [Acidobacteriota bacterium]
MKSKQYRIAATVILAAGVFGTTVVFGAAMQISALFSQDIALQETTTTTGAPMGGGGQTTGTSYFAGNAMKHTGSDGHDFIIRYDQNKTISIDHKKKTYSEMTFDEMQRMLDQALGGMKMGKEEMEAMRQVMGQTMGEVSVAKLGPGETVAGYSTEKYLIKMPPMEIQVWAAPGLSIPAVYYDAMRLGIPRNPMFDMGKMYEEFKKVNGMVVKSVTSMKMMGMNMTTTTVTTSVEKGAIPASTFEVPTGYKATPVKF